MQIKLVTTQQYGTNIGARTYMMDDDSNYEMFKLLNQEFTFDVDASNLPCGVNGALYFVEMPKDGGSGQYPGD
jgi:cellulose 1,4-beta-cellobiosidase